MTFILFSYLNFFFLSFVLCVFLGFFLLLFFGFAVIMCIQGYTISWKIIIKGKFRQEIVVWPPVFN